MIADNEIRDAEPAAVVEQYEPYIKKLANRYNKELRKTGAVGFDDLVQEGRIAILEAQKKYKPDSGSFMNCLYYYVRGAMRRALGFDNQTGAPPYTLVYLDEPLSDDAEATRGDMVADPDALPMDEPIIEDETRREVSEQVRAAVERMKSEKQRETITRVWFAGQKREAAAIEMGMKPAALRNLDRAARNTLRQDWRLKRFVSQEMPFVHVGVKQYNTTWISSTEYAAFWRLEHLQQDEQRQQNDNKPE